MWNRNVLEFGLGMSHGLAEYYNLVWIKVGSLALNPDGSTYSFVIEEVVRENLALRWFPLLYDDETWSELYQSEDEESELFQSEDEDE